MFSFMTLGFSGRRWFRVTAKCLLVLLGGALVLGHAWAQGLGGSGLTAADLAALRGSVGGVSAGGLTGTTGVSGLLAIPVPMATTEDEDLAPKDATGKPKKPAPLPPNEFQKYLLETTGQMLPLFGADFFENLANNNAQLSRVPVSDDYVIGPGDQLLIRVWGAASVEAPVTVDRRGEISFPRFGTLPLAGVKAGQLDAVVRQFFGKFFKDIEVSVAVSRLRKITVYAVGQARQPGSYALSSQSTLTTALFASGGPSVAGSVRRVQLKRQGQVVAEFDLYAFLGRGDKSADLKLQDGDVLFFPRAAGYMALRGKVHQAAVYELRDGRETAGDLLALAGGLPVVADPRKVTLERLQPGQDQPRSVLNLALDDAGLKTPLRNGDVLTVAPIVAEMANTVTLRGAVAQPGRTAWREGLRVTDVISRKSLLITPETLRRQNEVLFDPLEQERTARQRARVPADLAAERVLTEAVKKDEDKLQINLPSLAPVRPEPEPPKVQDPSKQGELTDRAVATAQLGKPQISEESLADRIGRLVEEINLDYAVIERVDRNTLQVSLVPFNLGKALAQPQGAEDPRLQPGDVITVFSANDIRVPASRRQVFVRVEGEVNNPGVYPVKPGDNLQTLIARAGGATPDAYLFAMGLYREDVKKSQRQNLEKLLRKLEAESSSAVAQVSQSLGATTDAAAMQAKVMSIQQAQRQSLERLRTLKPEGRIALGLRADVDLNAERLPPLRLENGDRIVIPPRPDFVYVFGAVNTESALIYKPDLKVEDYLQVAGTSVSSDTNGVILVRADGSAMTNQSFWGNSVLSARVMPGDTIVMPEKFDRESVWSQVVRSAKDFTQILYQLGLGAAAIKTLRQ